RQHRGEVDAQLSFDVSGLGEEPDDPTHMSQLYRGRRADSRSKPRFSPSCYVWFLHPSGAGEVLPQLPRSDLLVVAAPLLPLDADEVVDVVLVAGASERPPKDVVALELVRGFEQVRRQRPETA